MFGFARKRKMTLAIGDALRPPEAIKAEPSWHDVLEWYAKILAMVWLMKGLGAWARIFGVLGTGGEFLLARIDFQTAVVFFAVIDIIAAVGLWMLSAWGGVVWLVAVLSYVCIAVLFPSLLTLGLWSAWLFGFLLVVYFMLAWLAAREPHP